MQLPFGPDEFLDVFRWYNESVWPAQWALVALGVGAVVAAASPIRRLQAVPLYALSALWLWAGVVYHLRFFRSINSVAILFGLLFMVQAAVLAWAAWSERGERPRTPRPAAARAGAVLMTYALVIYPALGWLLGHRYPSAPTFGVPCPTTIFTLGLLLAVRSPISGALIVIPTIWSLVGTSAALQLGMIEDFGLPVAALVAIAFWPRQARPVAVPRSV